MLKKLSEDYKKSFLLIIDNKWLYGTVLFFVSCGAVAKIPALISQKMLIALTFGNTFPYTGVNQYAQQPLLEKLFDAVHSIHPLGVLSSLTFPAFFGFLGLIIAFFIFYKKIRPLRSTHFCKKAALYSFTILILSILLGVVAYFILQNESILLLSLTIGVISLGVLLLVLLTIIEALFISLLAFVLSGEMWSLESLSERSTKFIKVLFLFNVVLYFVSTNFINSLILLPNYLRLLHVGAADGAFGVLNTIFSNVGWFTYWFHPLFIIVFVVAPLTIATGVNLSFLDALKESALVIRRNFSYYFSLAIWTLLLLFILLTLSNFINPSILAISRPMVVNILHEAIYSLLFTCILLTFYVTAFRNILDQSRKG